MIGRRILGTLRYLVLPVCMLWGLAVWVEHWPSADDWAQALAADKLPGTLALAVAVIVALLCRGLRFVLLAGAEVRVSPRRDVAAYGRLLLLQTYTPLRLGEVAKVHWVRSRGGAPAYGVALVLGERILDLAGLLILTAVVIVTAPDGTPDLGRETLGLCLFGLTFLGGLWALARRSGASGEARTLRVFPRVIREGLAGFLRALATLARAPMARALALSLAGWIVLGLGFGAYLRSFFPALPVACGFLALTAVNLTGLLGLTPANAGGFEWAATAVLALCAVPPGEGIVAATTLHAAVLLLFTLFGAASLALSGAGEPTTAMSAEDAPRSGQFLYVVGAPRSGTTLLALILESSFGVAIRWRPTSYRASMSGAPCGAT